MARATDDRTEEQTSEPLGGQHDASPDRPHLRLSIRRDMQRSDAWWIIRPSGRGSLPRPTEADVQAQAYLDGDLAYSDDPMLTTLREAWRGLATILRRREWLGRG